MRHLITTLAAACLVLSLFVDVISGEEPSGDDRLKVNQVDPQIGPTVRASGWLGRRVESADGAAVGQVEDLAMDLEEGRVALVVVRPENSSSARLYLPPGVLREQGENGLKIRDSEINLDKAPKLKLSVTAEKVTRLWAAGVYQYFGQAPYWNVRKLTSTWSPASKFGQLYDPACAQTVTGEIASIDNLPPMPDMAMGTQLTLKTADESLVVVTAPVAFLSRQKIAFRKGDTVTVTGSRLTLGEREVMAAATIRQGEQIIELRGVKGEVPWGWTDADDAYGFSLLTSLLGMPVQNAKREDLGRVEDFAIVPDTGVIAYAAMSCSCFPDSSGKMFPIPLGAFVVEPQAKRWQLDLPENVLEKTPTFVGDQWPTQLDRGWIEYVHVRYGRSSQGGVRTAAHSQSQNRF